MTAPDRETLAAALHHEYHDADEFGCSFGFECYGLEWGRKAADHLLAGPLAPPPSEGEADEAAGRTRGLLNSIDPRVAADLRLLLADRELWRDRAFRAYRLAMEPEEGSEVETQATDIDGQWWAYGGEDGRDLRETDLVLLRQAGRSFRHRVVGPWRDGEPK